ncbi:hypothetical protein AXF21_04245 [Eubacterium minutum ATCC 700079]|nr:hypothetical protein AXF21_04245 [Eubacterium minutum ATCC 700079]
MNVQTGKEEAINKERNKMSKICGNKADTGRKKTSKAKKVAFSVLGIGLVTGAAVVLGLNQVMKKIFVSEDWPDEDWSGDDWAEEELE